MDCRFYDDDTNDCSYKGVCNKMKIYNTNCDCEDKKQICDCDKDK